MSETLAAAPEDRLVRLVVHGTLALGGSDPVASDIDVLAIVDDTVTVPMPLWRRWVTSSLSLEVPGRGLELSVVDARAAAGRGRRGRSCCT